MKMNIYMFTFSDTYLKWQRKFFGDSFRPDTFALLVALVLREKCWPNDSANDADDRVRTKWACRHVVAAAADVVEATN